MKILITGANGFLGSAIVRQALASGTPFHATDLHGSTAVPGIAYDTWDITAESAAINIPQSITAVVHAAGLAHVFDRGQAEEAPFHSINVTGTVNMMNAAIAAGAKHFVLISSVSVYGPFTEGMYNEDAPCKPDGPYAISKYEAESRASEIAGRTGMGLTILRLATLYGEGDPGNVGRLTRSLDRGRFIWLGTGSNRKSLLHKDDAARACLTAAMRPVSGTNVYNVSAPPCTMREIVDGIAETLGKYPFPLVVPASLGLFVSLSLSKIPNRRTSGLHQTIRKWLSEDIYDTRRFDETYNFKTVISLRDGLRREVDWYRNNRIAD